MKSPWTAAIIMTFVLVAGAGAQTNSGTQATEDKSPQASSGGGIANPSIQSPLGAGQEAGSYPEQLEGVLGAMSAELGEIAQAARDGKISRDQAQYLSMERYYVALTRFQLLRTMYQGPEANNPPQTYSQASQTSGGAIMPPIACSPAIPNQLVDYLQLTPLQMQGLQAQVTEECQQVEPLVERLDKSRRKLISMKMNGQAGDQEVQRLAAEQSELVKQLIVKNSQLETKLYSMLTTEQQKKIDALLRQSLDSPEKLPLPQ